MSIAILAIRNCTVGREDGELSCRNLDLHDCNDLLTNLSCHRKTKYVFWKETGYSVGKHVYTREPNIPSCLHLEGYLCLGFALSPSPVLACYFLWMGSHLTDVVI